MKKVNIIICSLIVSLILFVVLTVIQNQLISYEPKIKVFIAIEDINSNQKIEEKMLKSVLAPAGLINEANALSDFTENLYAGEKIHKGQIILKGNVGSKEELKIINKNFGYEKIAIKLRGPENAISYQIKPGDKINLYFTGKYISVMGLGMYDSNPTEGRLYTSRILEGEEILGIFDSNGSVYGSENFLKPDTLVIGVTFEKAMLINNLRSQGTFDITG